MRPGIASASTHFLRIAGEYGAKRVAALAMAFFFLTNFRKISVHMHPTYSMEMNSNFKQQISLSCFDRID
ncbi:hypothetical protein SLA2020_117850 [Shorea laevis]